MAVPNQKKNTTSNTSRKNDTVYVLIIIVVVVVVDTQCDGLETVQTTKTLWGIQGYTEKRYNVRKCT